MKTSTCAPATVVFSLASESGYSGRHQHDVRRHSRVDIARSGLVMNERRTTYYISWPTSYSASQLQLFTSSELVGAWLTMSLEPFPRPGAFQRCLETPVSTNDIRLTFRFLGGLWRTGQNRLIIHSINHIQRTRYCGVSRWKSPSGFLIM